MPLPGGILPLVLLLLQIRQAETACLLGRDMLFRSEWTGTIQSPNFDMEPYPQNQTCVWRVVLSRGSRVRIVFDEFDLEPGGSGGLTSSCQDYVKIIEGDGDTGQEMGTFCGSTTPPPLVSRSNQITVIFVSDENGGKKGFRLTYSGNCENMNVTTSGSVVESPNYPRKPPDNVRCEWWVSVPDNLFPLVRVPDFQTDATSCDDAIINLYGSFEEASWICKDRTDPVKFNGNKMIIEYTKKNNALPAIFALNVTFVDKCTEGRCENGGICKEEMFGVVCKCGAGFHGDRCELKLLTCADNPCKNQAECIETDEEIVCECLPGFAGETCEVSINECNPNPCLQGGTCVDRITDYSCICPDGYAGKNCETPTSECDKSPCQNGGTCQDFRNGFICFCTDNFTGETCQTPLNTCHQETCVNGECQGTPDGSICRCNEGFTGDKCDTIIDDCSRSPCNSGAECVDVEGGYRCICHPGYTGKTCHGVIDECSKHPCLNNGTCTNLSHGFRCDCPYGFAGNVCESDFGGCDPSPCKGGGICVELPDGDGCICPPGRTGKYCDEEVNPCSSNPCQNQAPCVSTSSTFGSAYVCECPLGFDGDKCQIEINECEPDPCKNGGSCTDMLNDFYCTCPRGFRGKICDISVSACNSAPCLNDAGCINVGNGFKCLCQPGYTGNMCDKNINECDESPCQNNATCIDKNGFFECRCVFGFEGHTCDNNIDDCAEISCEHDGTCVDMINNFRCDCSENFGGKRCEDFLFKDSPHCQDNEDENGIAWYSVRAGFQLTKRPCPPGILGEATRQCMLDRQADTGGVWSDPDLRSCVSPLLVEISNNARGLLRESRVTDREIAFVTMKLANATRMLGNSVLYPGDLVSATETMANVAMALKRASVSNHGLKVIAEAYGDAFTNIVDQRTVPIWKKVKDMGFIEAKVTDLVDSTELLAENMASKLVMSYRRRKRELHRAPNDSGISVLRDNIEFNVQTSGGYTGESLLSYQGRSMTSSISLPGEVFTISQAGGQGAFAVYHGKFLSVSTLLAHNPSSVNRTTNRTGPGVLNSDIIAAKILGIPTAAFDQLSQPVVITFKLWNLSLADTFAPLCSFLNVSARTTTARWPRTGCEVHEKNSSHVVCHCYHLTNFAVLMDVYGITGKLGVVHQTTLSFISYIGGTLSILGCILAIAVFEYFRLKSDRVRIHEQLAISIIMVQFIFLIGIDRKENEHVCKVFAVLLHYSLLAMFCWMLVEGIHLYVILVKVFKKGSHLKKYMALGWGIPLIIVAVSVGVFYDDYGQGRMCWMTNFMLLVLFVPIATVVILLNVFVLVVVVRVMMKSFAISGKANSEEASSLRITLKAAAVLLPLLGLTWSFCFLSFDAQATLLFTYLFTLFNCLQGVLFFIFHCFLNIDVRKAYERRYKRPKQTSVNVVNGDRNTVTKRKGSLMTTDSDPFVDTGPFNSSSLSYRGSTKSDDTEFSDMSFYSKQSLAGDGQTRINNLSSTVPDNVFQSDKITAESNLSHLPISS